MFRISKSDCEKAINNANQVNDQTIKLWKRCLKKIHKDFIFRSKEELEQQLLDINKTYSSAYNMSTLLRAACKINEFDLKLKEIVYDLYRDLREKSGIEQFENRMNKKQWTLEELITIMRNINMTDYKSTMIKLLLAMYTLNEAALEKLSPFFLVNKYFLGSTIKDSLIISINSSHNNTF